MHTQQLYCWYISSMDKKIKLFESSTLLNLCFVISHSQNKSFVVSITLAQLSFIFSYNILDQTTDHPL